MAPGVKLRGVDIQRPRSRPDPALPRGRAAADPIRQRLRSPSHDPLPRHPPLDHGRHAGIGEGIGGGQIEPGEQLHLRVRSRAVRPPPLPLSRQPARRPYLASGLYGAFVIDPKRGRPKADELVMVMNGFDTNFDRSNEVYAVNIDRLPLHQRARAGEARRAGADLSRQRARVRPDELLPYPRQLLPLLPDWDLAGADRAHRHGDPGSGAAGDPRGPLPVSGQVHVPRPRQRVRRARLDWVLRGGRDGGTRRDSQRRLAAAPAWTPRPRSAGTDRGRDRALRAPGRARPWRPHRAARSRSWRSSAPSCVRVEIELTLRNEGPTRSRSLRWLSTTASPRSRPPTAARWGRLGSTTLEIPYPWIEGEAYEVSLLTSTGGTIVHEIPVAAETPEADASFFGLMALLGVYVGVIPVGPRDAVAAVRAPDR